MNSQPESTRKNGEGLVVTEGGRRVSGTVHTTNESASQEAASRKKQLSERQGSAAPAVEVKRQLFG